MGRNELGMPYAHCLPKVEMLVDLRLVEFNRVPIPIMLGKLVGVQFQLICNVTNNRLGDFIFCGRKAPFIFKACNPAECSCLVFQSVLILINKCKMFSQLFNIPLPFYRTILSIYFSQ
jgi:hypothetical protein